MHDSDCGWVGPDKGPFNRRRTLLCRSGAAVVNARANGVLQILSQPMSMEVVTEQRSKRCCTLHTDALNFCTIISNVRCKFLHLGRLCSQYGGIYYLDHHNGLHWIKKQTTSQVSRKLLLCAVTLLLHPMELLVTGGQTSSPNYISQQGCHPPPLTNGSSGKQSEVKGMPCMLQAAGWPFGGQKLPPDALNDFA